MFGKTKSISPETFAQELGTLLGDRLVSAVLYGSAAAGDHSGKGSNYNVLLVVTDPSLALMESLAKPFARWMKAGNPMPLVFTGEGLKNSADVFPIELLDITGAHRILAGKDVVSTISVSRENLRHQVEYELRAKLLALRGAAVAAGGCEKRLASALVAAYSPVAANLRAALRLYEEAVPAEKQAAVTALARHIAFDPAPFAKLAILKYGAAKPAKGEIRALYSETLAALDAVVAAVDAL